MVKSFEKRLETRDKSEESLLSRFVRASVDFQKSFSTLQKRHVLNKNSE